MDTKIGYQTAIKNILLEYAKYTLAYGDITSCEASNAKPASSAGVTRQEGFLREAERICPHDKVTYMERNSSPPVM
jgi:hypothetical protein